MKCMSAYKLLLAKLFLCQHVASLKSANGTHLPVQHHVTSENSPQMHVLLYQHTNFHKTFALNVAAAHRSMPNAHIYLHCSLDVMPFLNSWLPDTSYVKVICSDEEKGCSPRDSTAAHLMEQVHNVFDRLTKADGLSLANRGTFHDLMQLSWKRWFHLLDVMESLPEAADAHTPHFLFMEADMLVFKDMSYVLQQGPDGKIPDVVLARPVSVWASVWNRWGVEQLLKFAAELALANDFPHDDLVLLERFSHVAQERGVHLVVLDGANDTGENLWHYDQVNANASSIRCSDAAALIGVDQEPTRLRSSKLDVSFSFDASGVPYFRTKPFEFMHFGQGSKIFMNYFGACYAFGWCDHEEKTDHVASFVASPENTHNLTLFSDAELQELAHDLARADSLLPQLEETSREWLAHGQLHTLLASIYIRRGTAEARMHARRHMQLLALHQPSVVESMQRGESPWPLPEGLPKSWLS